VRAQARNVPEFIASNAMSSCRSQSRHSMLAEHAASLFIFGMPARVAGDKHASPAHTEYHARYTALQGAYTGRIAYVAAYRDG